MPFPGAIRPWSHSTPLFKWDKMRYVEVGDATRKIRKANALLAHVIVEVRFLCIPSVSMFVAANAK